MVWRLVAEAQAQRALIAANSDMYDVKALGFLGLDGAVIGGLTAARAQLPALWWLAVVSLAVCVPFFLFTIVGRSFFVGPRVSAFYARNMNAAPAQAGERLLADLESDMLSNRKALLPKSLAFSTGLALFVLGALFTTVFLARTSVVD
jgi:hypothetical protein